MQNFDHVRRDLPLPNYLEGLLKNVKLFSSAVTTEFEQDEGLKRKMEVC